MSTADGGLERALEVLHAMLASTRFDPEALQRSKKERLLEHEQRNKSLNGLTWEVARSCVSSAPQPHKCL